MLALRVCFRSLQAKRLVTTRARESHSAIHRAQITRFQSCGGPGDCKAEDAREIQPMWSFAIFFCPTGHGGKKKYEKVGRGSGRDAKGFWTSLGQLRLERRFDERGRTTEKVTWS